MASAPLSIFVIGGHGKVALHFTRIAASRGHKVFSMIRQPEHASDLPTGSSADTVQPVVASLEQSSVSDIASLFTKYSPNVVLFAAGAGGKGGPERTKAVDEQGAIKVFDALEQSGIAKSTDFRRFLLVSAIDVRDKTKPPPAWYQQPDLERSEKTRKAIGAYMDAKYAADKNLSERSSFPWFVLRPGGLLDEPGTGKVALGVHQSLVHSIPREDVAATLVEIAQLPKGQGDGLMLDLLAGDNDIPTSVKEAIERVFAWSSARDAVHPVSLSSQCQAPKQHGENPLSGCPVNTTFVSRTHPSASHRTISAALNALPDDGSTHTVLIDAGWYHEKVLVHRSSPTILAGVTSSPSHASSNRVFVWQSSYVNQSDPRSTLRNCDAVTLGVGTGAPHPISNFKAYNIDFVQRQYQRGQLITTYQLGPAAALCVEKANASFYSCSFSSYQDTLYVGPASQAFFFKSTVKGMTDQLYGMGKAWFERTLLLSRACGGGITAWRGDPNDAKVGVYILNSHIARADDAIPLKKMHGKCYLGRPWNAKAHAVYLNTSMDGIVAKKGFRVWGREESNFDPRTTRFDEYGSTGAAGDVTGRNMTLDRILTREQASRITIASVFGDTSWIDWKRVWER
ncbi:Pectinesterase, catalytic [Kalmanozyma brasiliensis GHG001]|uniref:Pectinesterase, catalytic n=1 Tax=Kalmanozyma brasiliensis (strain GHG001) TaxID=1365824 RepID=UPI002867E776|nr:Pectinesterase, catalytic [Kalmanozyma brasiliensis GHG001]EST09535.2 Pectinesterase, catalytic [Kalmanozyma brasiliensis GHG001]